MSVRLLQLNMYAVCPGSRKKFISAFDSVSTRMPQPKEKEIREMLPPRASLAVFRWLLAGKHVAISQELFNQVKEEVIPYCTAEMDGRLRVIENS